MKKIARRDLEYVTERKWSSVYVICVSCYIDQKTIDFIHNIDELLKEVDPSENISFYGYDCTTDFELMEQYNIQDLPCVLYYGNGQFCKVLTLDEFDLTNGLKEFNKNCNIKYQLKKEVVEK